VTVQRESHYWFSPRLGRDMGVVVYGHYGPPLLAFPTTGGDEWEYERQHVIATIASFIDAGRVKVFCVNTNHGDSFGNAQAHPRHRSWMQARYDDYIVDEVVPFVRSHCRTWDIHLATGTGPWERPEEAYRLSRIFAARGVRHHLDDWGPQGGHDWPYWRHMIWEYLANA
jgi:esterase/lipase superfamily enzyme